MPTDIKSPVMVPLQFGHGFFFAFGRFYFMIGMGRSKEPLANVIDGIEINGIPKDDRDT
jgi:hypothetical protein